MSSESGSNDVQPRRLGAVGAFRRPMTAPPPATGSKPVSARDEQPASPATQQSDGTPGFDEKIMRELEAIRKEHMALRDIGVRAAANEERLTKEREALLTEMREKFNVDNLQDLRKKIGELEAQMTESVRIYGESVAKVRARIEEQGESL